MNKLLCSSDIEFALILNQLGVTARREILKGLRGGLSYEALFRSFERSPDYDLSPILKRLKPQKEMRDVRKSDAQVIDFMSPRYPPLLREIDDPPIVLYVRGELMPEDHFSVGIVGSRVCSFYGETQTRRFSRELSEAGVTIVSGLAKGIDGLAHEEALAVGGRTLAVLGCGVDHVYPKENRKLFEKIPKQGALISEYALGTHPLSANFPRRNRILAGLTLGVIVVEAHSRSGSSITAHQAMEQGREVFAIPGPIDQLTSRGTHQLIREGALITDCPSQVLEGIQHFVKPLHKTETIEQSELNLNFQTLPEKKTQKSPQHPIIELLKSSEKGLFLEEIEAHLDKQDWDLSFELLNLEIRGWIKRSPGGIYATV